MHLTKHKHNAILLTQYKINAQRGNATLKEYNYNISTNITRAMSKHNKIMPGTRFNTIDGNILSLVRSFHCTETKFYMSNKELAEIMIADPSTIQRSIDRLLVTGLLTKEVTYINARPQRLLIYQPEAVLKLLNLH